MPLRLSLVQPEALLELGVRGGVRQLGQELEHLGFGAVEVAQLFETEHTI